LYTGSREKSCLTAGNNRRILSPEECLADIGRAKLSLARILGIGGHVDIERTMQFILEQQAQFSAQFSNYQAQISGQFSAYQAQFSNDIVQINAVLLDLATTQERTNAILATLAERQIATEEAMGRLADRQNTTEQTLNTLLTTVERHIANHK